MLANTLNPSMALARVFAILFVVENVHSAIDTGVTVVGSTVAPNFKRLEGRRELYWSVRAGRKLDVTSLNHF